MPEKIIYFFFIFYLVIQNNVYLCCIKLNKMKTIENPTINIYTKKVYAGHYEVSVVCEETNEEFKYTETDMDLIDALENEDGNEWFTQFEAMQAAIAKASSGKY